MTLTITTCYAIGFAVVMLALWMNVVYLRAANHVSLGHGDVPELHVRIRQHGNFVEWVPITLILLGLAELRGSEVLWLHLCAGLALAGRIIHPFGINHDDAARPARMIGSIANLGAAIGLIVLLLLSF